MDQDSSYDLLVWLNFQGSNLQLREKQQHLKSPRCLQSIHIIMPQAFNLQESQQAHKQTKLRLQPSLGLQQNHTVSHSLQNILISHLPYKVTWRIHSQSLSTETSLGKYNPFSVHAAQYLICSTSPECHCKHQHHPEQARKCILAGKVLSKLRRPFSPPQARL